MLTAVAAVLLGQPDLVLADPFVDEFKIGVLGHHAPGL